MKTAEIEVASCTYCGEIGPTTYDHVPPKCLFPAQFHKGLIRVPSCQRCNGGSSKDDEYFRLSLIARDDVIDHEHAASVWTTAMRGLGRRESKGFRQAFLKSLDVVGVETPGGIFLGQRRAYKVNSHRLSRVASRILRGLFFHETGTPLSQDYYAIGLLRDGLMKPGRRADSLRCLKEFDLQSARLRRLSCVAIADGVFRYWRAHNPNDPGVSRWLLVFYDAVEVLGLTGPQSSLAAHESRVIGFP